MSEEYNEIDLNLDDVPDKYGIIPAVDTVFRVASATRVSKAGPDYTTKPSPDGFWPYVDLRVNPISDDPNITCKELMLVVSFNPKALFTMKAIREAMGLPTNVNVRSMLTNTTSDQDYIGKTFGCTPSIVASKKDPNVKVNQLNRPYRKAR